MGTYIKPIQITCCCLEPAAPRQATSPRSVDFLASRVFFGQTLNIDGRPAGPQFSGGCWKDKLAPQHLPRVMPNDPILLERGHAPWRLFNLDLDMNANFCARIPHLR
jgi:hypothetical protein